MEQQEFQQEWENGLDFVVCHTSGSTGVPKEIHLNKDFMRQSARRTNDFFNITSSSRLHTCLDFKYIASKMMTVRSEEAGCVLTSENPSNQPLKDITKEDEISLLSVVPSQMEWIIDQHVASGGKKFAIDNILIGGSSIPGLLRRRIALSGLNAWESYGMTETASHIALRRVDVDGSMPFKTLPGISVTVNDNNCLVINMPGMEKIVTNDLAESTSSGEFRILGRADNCIISGGIKIIPEILETILGPFIAFNYCLSSKSDPKWGERLVLVVEKSDMNFSDETIKKAVGVRLDQYKKSLGLGVKAPKEILVVDSFPLTDNGKLDRIALRGILEN